MRYFEVDIENAHLVMNEKEIEMYKSRNGNNYKVLTEFTENELKKYGFDISPKLETAEQLDSAIKYYLTGVK